MGDGQGSRRQPIWNSHGGREIDGGQNGLIDGIYVIAPGLLGSTG